MAKEDWFRLRGYYDGAIFSFHLDSLLCYAAVHAGIREVTLSDPMRMYHIEHTGGWTPESDKTMNRNLESKGIPRISNEDMNSTAVQMRIRNQTVIFNKEDWGLSAHRLKEEIVE